MIKSISIALLYLSLVMFGLGLYRHVNNLYDSQLQQVKLIESLQHHIRDIQLQNVERDKVLDTLVRSNGVIANILERGK